MTPSALAGCLDHSLLSPTLTERGFDAGCHEAVELKTATLCVRSADLGRARLRVGSAGLPLCAVIGFPQANTSLALTLAEAAESLAGGAVELDLVAGELIAALEQKGLPCSRIAFEENGLRTWKSRIPGAPAKGGGGA